MSMMRLPPALDAAIADERIRAAYGGRTVCVTGGAGFIGSHLTDALVALGARVVVLDDFSSGREENLRDVSDTVRLVCGSILDDASLDDAVAGCTTIFHLGALGSVPASVAAPVPYVRTNVLGTLAVLEAARRAEVGTVVYAASSSAYGDQAESPKVESMRPDPLSPYAASKLAGESLLRCHALCYGLSCASLRYFNVFGPRQRADSDYAAVIPRFVAALRGGEIPTVHGDGTQTRDFTPVANVVWANLLAGAHPDRLVGEVFNIAGGRALSLLELLDLLRTMIPGAPGGVRHTPPRVGDVMHSVASIAVAERRLGYRPLLDVEEGLRLLTAAG